MDASFSSHSYGYCYVERNFLHDVSDVSDCSHLRELTSQLIAVLRSLSLTCCFCCESLGPGKFTPRRVAPPLIIFLMWLGSSGRIWCSDSFCG